MYFIYGFFSILLSNPTHAGLNIWSHTPKNPALETLVAYHEKKLIDVFSRGLEKVKAYIEENNKETKRIGGNAFNDCCMQNEAHVAYINEILQNPAPYAQLMHKYVILNQQSCVHEDYPLNLFHPGFWTEDPNFKDKHTRVQFTWGLLEKAISNLEKDTLLAAEKNGVSHDEFYRAKYPERWCISTKYSGNTIKQWLCKIINARKVAQEVAQYEEYFIRCVGKNKHLPSQ